MSESVCNYICLFLSPLSSASVCLCLFLTLCVFVGILLYFYNVFPQKLLSKMYIVVVTNMR